MFTFILRRLVTSTLVVLASTFLMYILTDLAIDPLEDLRTSTAPNKEALIEGRIAQLSLDEPVVVRYVDWLAGASKCVVGQCDLGTAWRSIRPSRSNDPRQSTTARPPAVAVMRPGSTVQDTGVHSPGRNTRPAEPLPFSSARLPSTRLSPWWY